MRVIAINTGGSQTTLAAVRFGAEGAEVCALQAHSESRQLARDLMRWIDATLDDAGWALADLEVLAVALGPGSWTGLRIGLSTVKTLAQTLECPLAGVPTFDAIAQAAWRQLAATEALDDEPRLLLTALPCRAGELYGQLYQCSDDYIARAQDAFIAPAARLADTLAVEAMSRGIGANPILAGPAAETVGAVFAERGEPFLAPPVEESQICIEIALAGFARIEAGEGDDPLTLQPLYLAPSAAERNLSR